MRMMRRKGIISRVLGKPFSFLLIATAAVAALVAFAVGPTEIPTLHAQSIPTDPLNGCPVPSATFAGWFETGVPAQDGVVKPADSTMFPGNPNCDFYFWSKQMFLWLTSPAPSRYGGGTRIFNSPTFFDVTPLENGSRSFSKHEPGIIRFFRVRIAKPGPNGLPVIFDKRHRMFEVALPKRGPGGNPVILNRLNKEVEVTRITVSPTKRVTFFDNAGRRIVGAKPLPVRPAPIEVPQAKELPKNKAAAQKAALMRKIPTAQLFMFNRRPIFIDALGNPIDPEEGQATTNAVLMAQNQSLVYYATMVNDVYAYFLTGNKTGAFNPAFTTFPITAQHLTQVQNFATTKGVTFPDPIALAIEVKTAWVEASSLPNASDYITATATVPDYNTTNPANWVPTGGTRNVTLALISIHVVGSALGHPEMIWATFEHFGTAPNAQYSYNSTAGTNPKIVNQNTSGTWLLSANGALGQFNCEHMSVQANGDIQAVAPPGNCTPPVPGTVSPSDTLRKHPWGIAGGNASSNTEIISIHNTTQVPGNDIRNKYFMTGATWTPFGTVPSFNPPNLGVGTNILANSALETYTQDINCFGCHTGPNMLGDSGGQTGLSHIYGPLKPLP